MNHVFVDFENVPSVDLSLIKDQQAEVTLLIGEKQRRLDLGLVRQIHEHAEKITLIEVGASGHNALDLVLAWHLGKVAERHPADPFFVVSKDKDFDPLLRHLRDIDLNVTRVDSFSALPFLARPPAVRPPTAGAKSSASEDNDRLAKLIHRLQHNTTARPARRKKLLSHINGFYDNSLPEPELEEIAEKLQQRGVVKIDPQGRVDYPVAGKPSPATRKDRARRVI